MKNLLIIHSSPLQEASLSRLIANQLTEKLRARHPSLIEKTRDLAAEEPPHWGSAEILAARTSWNDRGKDHRKILAESDLYCEELLWANQIVLSVPMWNFSVPSTLKAWIDHIVRVGVTFKYGQQGPIGLVQHLEKVFIVESTGGIYSGKTAFLNHVAPYLESVFKFIGAKEVQIISIQGTAINAELAKNQALAQLENIFE